MGSGLGFTAVLSMNLTLQQEYYSPLSLPLLPRRDQRLVSKLLFQPGCVHPEPGSVSTNDLWDLLGHQQNLGRRRHPRFSSVLLPHPPNLANPPSHPHRACRPLIQLTPSGLGASCPAGALESSNTVILQRKTPGFKP